MYPRLGFASSSFRRIWVLVTGQMRNLCYQVDSHCIRPRAGNALGLMLLVFAVSGLRGCNVGDPSPQPQTYTIGGSVSGLAGSGLVLQNNGGNNLAVSANGEFTFSTALDNDAGYSVTVLTQPTDLSQTCAVKSGSGSVSGADVTNISVTCTTDTFSISGTVSGLAGSGLVLQDNGGNNLAVTANGSFIFTALVASGSPYKVTVFSEPTNVSQTCAVTSGSGTVIAANVGNVSVACTTDKFTVGGNVSGLSGSGLVLQDNSGNNLSVSGNGPFVFSTSLASGSPFDVTILTEPSSPSQACSISNAIGLVTTQAITAVTVTCPVATNLLAVADYGNSRVITYGIPFATGENAAVVLGQPNATSATPGATATTMGAPSWLAMDSYGNLYVADDTDCRVTQYQPPFTTGMSATIVFGQSSLSSATCSASTSSTTLGNATNASANSEDDVFGVVIDPSGNLWVADDGNNRILEYVPPFSSGMAAALVIGQPNFVSGNANQGAASPSAGSLFDPGCVFDASGNLWVADFYNNRLLEFVPPFSTGMSASLVLGQQDFTHGSANQGGSVAANTFNGPNGVAFDSSGNLWVSDSSNNRVLEFEPPFTTGMSASLVLGQPNTSQGTANEGNPGAEPSGSSFMFPGQIAFDSSGNLFVADANNNRTLMFTPPFSTGMTANLVLGQPNVTSSASATTAAGQNFPTGALTAPPLN